MSWLSEVSLALGTGKLVARWALAAPHHQLPAGAPGLHQGQCRAVSGAASWTGAPRAAVLRRLLAGMGRPAADLKDGGRALQKARGLLAAQGLARPAIADLSPAVAKMRTRRYHAPPKFLTLVSAGGRGSGKLKHPRLACRAPPTRHPTARFMHVHRLVTGAARLLPLSPAGGAKAGSPLATLRAGRDLFPSGKAFLQRFRDDARPLWAGQTMRNTQGRSHAPRAQGAPLRAALPSLTVRREFAGSLQSPLQTATRLGLAVVGLPISSDPIESLFGLAKHHGVGAIKEANRRALPLPAVCGTPPREEATPVLERGGAEPKESTGRFTSLTTPRREVRPNPDARERWGTAHAHTQVELLPSSKNRSPPHKTVNLSIGYKEVGGPGPKRQEGHPHPDRAVS